MAVVGRSDGVSEEVAPEPGAGDSDGAAGGGLVVDTGEEGRVSDGGGGASVFDGGGVPSDTGAVEGGGVVVGPVAGGAGRGRA